MIKTADFGKRFAIHASREIHEPTYDRIATLAPELLTIDRPSRDTVLHVARGAWYKLTRDTSAVIAVATLRDALYIGGNAPETTRSMLDKLDLADQERWTFGPTVYVLRDVVALPKPVPCRGWQGFWTLAPDLERAVWEQLS